MTADGGVPLAQSVDGAGAGFVDGPDSEGQNTAAEVAATDSEGDAALPETQPDAVPEGGADGEAEAAPGGKSDAEPDGDGTALAMSGSSGPVVINPSSSIKNVRQVNQRTPSSLILVKWCQADIGDVQFHEMVRWLVDHLSSSFPNPIVSRTNDWQTVYVSPT